MRDARLRAAHAGAAVLLVHEARLGHVRDANGLLHVIVAHDLAEVQPRQGLAQPQDAQEGARRHGRLVPLLPVAASLFSSLSCCRMSRTLHDEPAREEWKS